MGCSHSNKSQQSSTTNPISDQAIVDEICIPNKAVFDGNIKPILDSNCTKCHSSPPQFGAPFPLVDYDEMLMGEAGSRIVDRAFSAIADGSMPPGSQDDLEHGEFDTLVQWLSCGTEHPDYKEGVHASRPEFTSVELPPATAKPVDLTATDFEVSPTTLDHYEEFHFDHIVDKDMFIRRIEGILDDTRVVHHLTLNRQNYEDETNYIYAWAPGTGAVQFADGGLRLRPEDKLVVEIHYNNGAGFAGVSDSSGIRLYVDEPAGTEYGVLDVVTWNIEVPPEGKSTSVARCTASEEFKIIAGMPHMHETGSEFKQNIRRVNGNLEELFSLTGWSFESQPFYQMPTTIFKGDILETRCTYENHSLDWVFAGLGTKDEMCFNFLYVTPASVGGECDE